MATLSAHSRRSPTTTAESPILEQQFDNIEMQYPDEIKSIHTTVNKDMEHIETNTEENSAKAKSQTKLHSTCVTEVNMTIQKTSTKKGNSLNDLSKHINTEKEMSRLGVKLISKTEDTSQNVTAHLEILVS